jgi:hypothetical protein
MYGTLFWLRRALSEKFSCSLHCGRASQLLTKPWMNSWTILQRRSREALRLRIFDRLNNFGRLHEGICRPENLLQKHSDSEYSIDWSRVQKRKFKFKKMLKEGFYSKVFMNSKSKICPEKMLIQKSLLIRIQKYAERRFLFRSPYCKKWVVGKRVACDWVWF